MICGLNPTKKVSSFSVLNHSHCEEEKKNEWVEGAIATKVTTKNRTMKKDEEKKLPAVMVAEPGQSYNPSFEDHQDTLGSALAQELELAEKEKFLDEQLKVRRKRTKRKKVEAEQQEEHESEDDEQEEDKEHVNVPNVNIKPKSVRNKEKRKREFGMQMKEKRDKKKMRKDFAR